jgi:hypothetical protein
MQGAVLAYPREAIATRRLDVVTKFDTSAACGSPPIMFMLRRSRS